jgi:UDP-glucose 4-epimerase
MKKGLVIGGAGFIGSNTVHHLSETGISLTVIDGLLPFTGATVKNLAGVLPNINFIKTRLEDTEDLTEIIEESDFVVSAFGWTSHKAAFEQPMYDLELNLKAHVHLLEKIKASEKKPFVINLGSSVQFGKVNHSGPIHINDEQFPLDIQGIHKIAAESYYRIFATMYGVNVYSLRIPNCFGPGQKMSGDDIGLIGSFVIDALAGKEIIVFGENRRRSVLFVTDLVKIIGKLSNEVPDGFVALNMPAHNIEISTLAEIIIKLAGNGKLVKKQMPSATSKMDFPGAELDSSGLKKIYPDFFFTPLEDSINETINYFKRFK